MIRSFIDQFAWCPKIVDMVYMESVDRTLDDSTNQIYQEFLSAVEEVRVDINRSYDDKIVELCKAVACSKRENFRCLTLAGCVTVLAELPSDLSLVQNVKSFTNTLTCERFVWKAMMGVHIHAREEKQYTSQQ